MRILLTEVVNRSKGGEIRRQRVVEASSLRIGRSATCEVHIADPRVLLHQATIEQRAGGIVIVAEAEGGILVNGSFQSVATLKPGDRIEFGPYRITVREPAEGCELTLKLVQVAGHDEDTQTLASRSKTELHRVGLGKRGLSYLLFALVAGLFLVVPLIASLSRAPVVGMTPPASHWPANADRVWSPGPTAGPHRFFGETCTTCHQQPFVQVRDTACLSCHATVEQHADPKLAVMANLTGVACQSCHKEHTATNTIVLQDDRFCTSCHGDLSKHVSPAKFEDVRDFGKSHPEFRPTLPADAAAGKWERASLGGATPPQDRSGLKFPHDRHLKAGLRHPDKGNVQLACSNCHLPDSGGVGMLPPRFEATCHECHALKFDALATQREIPHGPAVQAEAAVADFYAAQALRGEVRDPLAPEAARRRPGQAITEPERVQALAWAEAKTRDVLNGKAGRGLCGECHELDASRPGLSVVPPLIAQRWLPHGTFPHKDHRDIGCVDCHKAPDSKAATDVLLPGIANCRQCHGGEGEKTAARVETSCVACHQFHRAGMPLMHAQASAAPGQAVPPRK